MRKDALPKLAAVFLSLALFLGALSLITPQALAAPIRTRHVEWNISAPGANTDAISDVTWQSGYPARVTLQVETGTVVNLMVNRSGTEKALGLNANTALTAGAVYTFDVYGLQPDDVLNVQVETDSAISNLSIFELRNMQ